MTSLVDRINSKSFLVLLQFLEWTLEEYFANILCLHCLLERTLEEYFVNILYLHYLLE